MTTTIATVKQLGTAAVAVPQCIDNQFMPRRVFEALGSQEQTLPQVIERLRERTAQEAPRALR